MITIKVYEAAPDTIPSDLKIMLEAWEPEIVNLTAKQVQNMLVFKLLECGLYCKSEFILKDRGDGKGGRVDIVAWNEDIKIAFEIDGKSPRKKSLFKLRSLDLIRVCVLRNPNPLLVKIPEKIHVVLSFT